MNILPRIAPVLVASFLTVIILSYSMLNQLWRCRLGLGVPFRNWSLATLCYSSYCCVCGSSIEFAERFPFLFGRVSGSYGKHSWLKKVFSNVSHHLEQVKDTQLTGFPYTINTLAAVSPLLLQESSLLLLTTSKGWCILYSKFGKGIWNPGDGANHSGSVASLQRVQGMSGSKHHRVRQRSTNCFAVVGRTWDAGARA